MMVKAYVLFGFKTKVLGDMFHKAIQMRKQGQIIRFQASAWTLIHNRVKRHGRESLPSPIEFVTSARHFPFTWLYFYSR